MTDPHIDPVADLLAQEQQRCHCLATDDFEGLRALLHPDLHHTHNRGNSDDLASYLDYVSRVEAQVLQVWVREAGGPWRLAAFQATPLGAPPPAAAR